MCILALTIGRESLTDLKVYWVYSKGSGMGRGKRLRGLGRRGGKSSHGLSEPLSQHLRVLTHPETHRGHLQHPPSLPRGQWVGLEVPFLFSVILGTSPGLGLQRFLPPIYLKPSISRTETDPKGFLERARYKPMAQEIPKVLGALWRCSTV